MEKNKKVKQPANAPDPIIIQNIEVRPWTRTQQDIPNWRRAIQSAESQIPRRVLLYNLYADVDLDGHVEAVTGKRRDHVKAANWQFVDKEGKPIDAINDLIDSIGFDDLLEEIINARFWGYSILEPTFWKGEDGKWQMEAGLLPRLNYRPEKGIVSKQIYGDDGINIREGIYAKTIMEVGKVTDLGLYMKAAPYQILKRGGLGDYAAFIQTFGNPIIDATWDGVDEAQRVALSKSLEALGAGGALVRPSGTTVEIIENNVNTTGDAHGSFFKLMNAEISKALLGTTETTESSTSSGYAQSETHQDEDDIKHDNDISYCRKNLNSRFIRLMQAAGIDTQGGWFIIQGEETELTKAESFTIHKGLSNDIGLPIEDDFWYETYGVPKPDNYDQMKAEKLAKKEMETDPAKTKGKKPTVKKNKTDDDEDIELAEGDELEIARTLDQKVSAFIKKLASFFVKAPAETTGAMKSCGHHHTINLAETDQLDNDALIHRIWKSNGKATWDTELFWNTSEVLIKGFKQGWNKVGIVNLAEGPGFIYGADDPILLTAYEANLFRFSGSKTLAQVQLFNQLFRESSSFNEFYQKAMVKAEIFNKKWLETEYTSAVLTGTAAVSYYRLKKQAKFLPYWKYNTVGDDRVRPEHAILDGLILHHTDSRWNKIFPPNGWRCRCDVTALSEASVTASQLKQSKKIADAYLGSPQFSKEEAQGWGVNRALLKKVFLANQNYANKFPGKAKKLLNNLKPQDYGLLSYSQAKKSGTKELPIFQGSKDVYFDALEKREGKSILPDYHNRPIVVVRKDFYDHVTDNVKSRQYRLEYLEALKETLLDPDEVWNNQKKGLVKENEFLNFNYIKYYKDFTIVVNLETVKGELVLKTWYPMTEKASVINDKRRGLLVLKK